MHPYVACNLLFINKCGITENKFNIEIVINMCVFTAIASRTTTINNNIGKAVPLHAMKALGGRGGIAPSHSRPRH
jgi:hypothetical protein